MAEVEIPSYRDLLIPVLTVIEQAHGSLTKSEVDDAVVELLGISDDQLAVAYPPGSSAKGSKVLHRIAFARSSMKLVGALDNSIRGVWTITPEGRELLETGDEAARRADMEARRKYYRKNQSLSTATTATEEQAEEDTSELAATSPDSWRTELLDTVQNLTADAFERLCARLLRAAGCRDVKVTRSSGDEGIDGVGTLEISLLSFPVFFQAKKYAGTVGPNIVRELRGSMVGRGDKGILITTGRFSSGAKEEAGRPGAPPIDLIDGDRLCDLMLEHELGVEMQPVVNSQYLDSL
jgi:restriction system protein